MVCEIILDGEITKNIEFETFKEIYKICLPMIIYNIESNHYKLCLYFKI